MKTFYSSWNEAASTKIFPLPLLLKQLAKDRVAGCTIATLNGSFDLMHAGHLHILFEASKKADKLVIALNTDASIKKYKDPSRPIIPLQERMELVSAISFVDYVTWFDETDPRELLHQIRPNIHVNGIEYTENCIEADTVRAYGGSIYLVERIPGLATSQIIETIKKL